MSKSLLLISIALLLVLLRSDIIRSISVTTEQVQNMFMKEFCSGCSIDGKDCQFNIKMVADSAKANHFNLDLKPISKNPLRIIKIQMIIFNSSISYKFPKVYLPDKSMLSLIACPETEYIKGIIAYFHPTVFGKWNSPSSLNETYKAIAGFFASQGYAVVMPDYLGYANDPDQHPYVLYPQQTVRGTVNLLNQLANSTVWKRYKNVSPIKLYSLGYSQGGAYSLWMSRCLQFRDQCPFFSDSTSPYKYYINLNPLYDYSKAGSMEGAYDLSGVVKNFLYQDISKSDGNPFHIHYEDVTDVAKPGLVILTLAGYCQYTSDRSLPTLINTLFYKLDCTVKQLCKIDGVKYINVYEALQGHGKSYSIGLAFGFAAVGKNYPPYLTKYGEPPLKNSILSLVDNDFLKNDKDFQSALKDATIVDYGQRTKSLDRDSVVSPLNADNFLRNSAANDKVTSYFFPNDEHLICEGIATVDHLKGEPLTVIYGLAFIEKN